MAKYLLTDRQCRIFLKDIQEFGYDVTFEEIRQLASDYAAGKEMTDVVGVIMQRQIEEALGKR